MNQQEMNEAIKSASTRRKLENRRSDTEFYDPTPEFNLVDSLETCEHTTRQYEDQAFPERAHNGDAAPQHEAVREKNSPPKPCKLAGTGKRARAGPLL